MAECLSCGAPTYPGLSACEYCGTILEVEPGARGNGPLEQAWELLHYRRSLGVPRAKDVVLQFCWWIVVIFSLGLVALVWRRPRSRCVVSEHKVAMENLRFLSGTAELHATDRELSRLRTIKQAADKLDAEVQAARKRTRWALVGVVVALLALSEVGRAMERAGLVGAEQDSSGQSSWP